MSGEQPHAQAVEALAAVMSVNEARSLAAALSRGDHIQTALKALSARRRQELVPWITAAGVGHTDLSRSVGILHAIAGSKSAQLDIIPVWTLPGQSSEEGHLTSQFYRLVDGARQSIVCATYNFQTTSKMWTVLKNASEEHGVEVTLYVDGTVADLIQIKQQLPLAQIFGSGKLEDGRQVRSHAKFVMIDNEMLLVTSANFSFSAENTNVEFGLLLHDAALCQSVIKVLKQQHGLAYRRI